MATSDAVEVATCALSAQNSSEVSTPRYLGKGAGMTDSAARAARLPATSADRPLEWWVDVEASPAG